ncbi:MAG: hypothetical protein KEFWMYNX_002265 [Candidatus Fervidibacter sp.]
MDNIRGLFEALADRYDAWYDGLVGRIAFPLEVACLRPLLKGAPFPWLEVGGARVGSLTPWVCVSALTLPRIPCR